MKGLDEIYLDDLMTLEQESPAIVTITEGDLGGAPVTHAGVFVTSDSVGTLTVYPMPPQDYATTPSPYTIPISTNFNTGYIWSKNVGAAGVYTLTFRDTNGLTKEWTATVQFANQDAPFVVVT